MKKIVGAGAVFALAFAIPAWANTKIRIDTVPATYTPQNYNRSERVRISSYHFEVNQELSRTRLVVIYTYRDQITYGSDDDKGGPQPTSVEIPGLVYDAKAQSIVYDAGGVKTVCATVQGKDSRHLKIKNTGACTVTTVLAEHVDDNSFNGERHAALDTYFEVQ
jgi:hypothetical protein